MVKEMNKNEKHWHIAIIILILITCFLVAVLAMALTMPETAQAHYNELESKTPQSIERARVRAIIGGVDV